MITVTTKGFEVMTLTRHAKKSWTIEAMIAYSRDDVSMERMVSM